MSPFPLARSLGIEIETLGEGHAKGTITLAEDHKNPHGSVHGGVIFTLVDTAMGAAAMSVLAEGEMCASIEVHMRFIRPVFEGTVTADTKVIHRGKRVVQLDGSVTGADGKLVATATASFAVIPLA